MKPENQIALKRLKRILLLALLLAIAGIVYSIFQYQDQSGIREVEKMRESTASTISSTITEVVSDLYDFTVSIGIDDFDHSTLNLYIQILMDEMPYLAGLTVAYSSTAVYDHMPGKALSFFRSQDSLRQIIFDSKEFPYNEMDWFTVPKYLETDVWLEPLHAGSFDNEFLIPYAAPIYRFSLQEQQEFIGVAVSWIDITLLNESLEKLPLRNKEIVLVVSHSGTIISSSINVVRWRKYRNLYSLAEEQKAVHLKKVIHTMFKKGRHGTVKLEQPFSGANYISYTPLADGNYFLLFLFNKN